MRWTAGAQVTDLADGDRSRIREVGRRPFTGEPRSSVSSSTERDGDDTGRKAAAGRLVVVSNRVPVPGKRGASGPGGLAVALEAALIEQGGIWFGWSGESRAAIDADAIERKVRGRITFAVTDLTKRDVDEYYLGFSNRALWPVCHYRLDLAHYDEAETEAYFRVNAMLARKLGSLLEPDDTIWVHDYHLLPLGKTLRDRGVDGRIGFFLHIPWPAPEVASALPAYRRILASMTAYDLVGFQTPRDAENFGRCLLEEKLATMVGDGLFEANGRVLRVDAFPIGIDTEAFAASAEKAEAAPAVRRMMATLTGQQLVIGVDRLDYSKGIEERIKAFRCFLEAHTDDVGRATYLQVTPKSRSEVPEYQDIQREVAGRVGEANGTFGDVDWTPIRYLNQNIPHATLTGLYRSAQVGLVTPLRDGMNLVAKEYVACQRPENPGVLVLSRYAGAAFEMGEGAILVNPYDAAGTARAISQGLAMPLGERRERFETMMRHLRRNTVGGWWRGFIAALGHRRAARAGGPRPEHLPTRVTARRLGAEPIAGGTSFRIRAPKAAGVALCLFGPDEGTESRRIPLRRDGQAWYVDVEGVGPGQFYGYRVDGPYAPAEGHRFNPNKLLIDPYARLLSGPVRWDDTLHGFDPASPDGDLSFDRRDSAPFLPRSVVCDPAFDWGDDRPPRRPMAETVIYEAHVRSLTVRHPAVPPAWRGRYEALGHAAIVDHLQGLGVTALQLLPIHAFADDRFLIRRGLVNYWGYSTLAFFAPERRYLGPGGIVGLKGAIKALHAAGIEVILDVVYNHTAELEETGPTLSFRGIDNAGTYRPVPGDPRRTDNITGCGNALDGGSPAVRSLILDSLRFWVEEYRVDGFRFDLAPVIFREGGDFRSDAALFEAIRGDPVLAGVKLIAEPWDLGPDGYALGRFPAPFSEWNDRARDGYRRFWRGDRGALPGFVQALAGSREIFDPSGRPPQATINYVASHDGFTLADIVAYAERHNGANGENGRDGHGDNHSWNGGVEGPADDPAIRAARARDRRNLLASAFLSLGTPMLLAGDELGRSQGGNNNAYCQDNATTWIDWESGIDPDLAAFFAHLTAIRREHAFFHRRTFLTGTPGPDGRPDVTWLSEDGHPFVEADWHDGERRRFAMLTGTADGPPLLLAVNGSDADVAFVIPHPDGGSPPGFEAGFAWRRILDTASPTGAPDATGRLPRRPGTIVVTARSASLFATTSISARD